MKTGFVTLFGRSNVGKSTLLNRLVGTKIAITSPKPQTTRQPLQGVVHADEGQIVFVDTPGLFTSAKNILTRSLNQIAQNALKDVDVIVHVVDPTRAIGPEDKKISALLRDIKKPKILVINKIDLYDAPFVASFESHAAEYDEMVKLSAQTGQHTGSLIQAIFRHLPEGEPIYAPGQWTNMDNAFWFAELIREKLFLRLNDELPYSLTVKVDALERRTDGTLYIKARIITAQDRYKGMIVGRGGRGIREIGQSARKEIEGVTGTKAYLDLTVVVDPHWTEEFRE